jgi:DNA topoisomerase-1
VSKNLVIVESPAKAKTIEKFLGGDFVVRSSYGHVRDLPRKGLSIDVDNGFEPTYEISADKQSTIQELRREVKTAVTVWLATDEDREGEAIAWHLAEALGLDVDETRRIVFHEITKPAILDAIARPRNIDRDLVDAQQARRILDRLVGYELSFVLWKKISKDLSAGRVQSVAVRLVVEREREIDTFSASSTFKVSADFDLGEGVTLSAKLGRDFPTEGEARAFLGQLQGAKFRVEGLEVKPASRSPRPPFTTSTLQQEASQKLGFSVRQTMVIAQRLYESGRITYMRTDSVNLSDLALGQAREVISGRFGQPYAHTRRFKTRSASAQEAHEAIRPTDLAVDNIGGDRNEQRLYQLIWRRTLASQMADARIERTTASIAISSVEDRLVAKGEVLTFEGFLKVYQDNGDEEKMLPPLTVGQALSLAEIRARESFTRPPARYTEATLVRKLEEMGIGRPSTYAPTISTIQDRGYVSKEDREGEERQVRILVLRESGVVNEDKTEVTGAEKGKLFPSDMAGVVTDFLVKYFSEVIDYNFTANVEAEFDEIAAGKKRWRDMLAEFYGPFHADIERAEDLTREEASQTRQLGTDPESGKPVSVRIGRFGPYVQIGTREDEDKPRFAGLRPGQRMDTITLEEAMQLFQLPRFLGETPEGEEVTANIGRFGPYVKFDNKYVSIRGDDPHSITLERALELIQAKKEADANREIKVFEGSSVQVLNGRYGPYITDGKKNARVPKDREPASLTLEECQLLLAEAPERRGRGRVKKGAAAGTAKKKAAVKKKSAPKKKAAPKKSAVKKKSVPKQKASG